MPCFTIFPNKNNSGLLLVNLTKLIKSFNNTDLVLISILDMLILFFNNEIIENSDFTYSNGNGFFDKNNVVSFVFV